MRRKISIVLFWALIVLSVVALAQSGWWKDWRDSLRTAAFVVPIVLFNFWFQGRFTGARRRAANIMIFSALFAMVSGAFASWNLILLHHGFEAYGRMMEVVVGGAVFVVCGSVFIWSLWRLFRPDGKLPA
jgi:hypothetical protein